MLNPPELLPLSSPHPELLSIINHKLPGHDAKPLLSLHDIHTARAFIRLFNSILASTSPKPKSSLCYKTSDIQVTVRDGTLLPGRVYTPKRMSTKGCPGMYICHGGGYVLGELDGQGWLGEIWAGLGGVAVDVLYRHAPEWRFPVGVVDGVDGFGWVSYISMIRFAGSLTVGV